MGIFNSIKKGLSKTRDSIAQEISSIIGGSKLTEEMLEDLEERLICADIGVESAFLMVDTLRDRALGKNVTSNQAMEMLADVAAEFLLERPEDSYVKPLHVVLVIGVNGAGKTTSIGKLANRFQKEGKKVMVAAGDTFRAAAIDQLEIWAERAKVDIVKHQEHADSAAVAFDAYEAAKARGHDVLIIDTAGRLHNKEHLMKELAKIIRILQKHDPKLPHETILVIDGTTGQNAINQTKGFHKDMSLSSLVVTKLDGTAKGGSVLAISKELGIPIKWIGTGEGIDDLAPFSKQEYIAGLFQITES
jgi:fused signal recognition particle receptor